MPVSSLTGCRQGSQFSKEELGQDRYRFNSTEERFFRLSKTIIKERQFQLSNLSSRIHRPDRTLRQYTQHSYNLQKRLTISARNKIASSSYSFAIQHQALSHHLPTNLIKTNSIYFLGYKKRLWNKIGELLHNKRTHLKGQVFALQALSPLQTLSRGFATLQTPDEQMLISSINQVKIDDAIQANLKDGNFLCKVTQIQRDTNE